MSLDRLREEVCHANRALPKAGLVTMHSGNASGYDPESGLVLIKPSGVDYDRLQPSDLPAVSLDSGAVVEGSLKPSVDLPHHLFLYRRIEGLRGVIHTHSNYATAFAAAHRPIPLALTAIADEFGEEIPCTPYVDNEGEHIGEAILQHRGRGPAILLGSHGVFAWGASPKAALKAAVMVEDVAKTCWLSTALGGPVPLPEGEAQKWWDRYHSTYGQR